MTESLVALSPDAVTERAAEPEASKLAVNRVPLPFKLPSRQKILLAVTATPAGNPEPGPAERKVVLAAVPSMFARAT